MNQTDTEKAIAYLFGEIGAAERDALEDRIFADEDFATFLAAVENDLADDYARGEMDAALRQRFEQKYLISAVRREKVRAAKILQSELFGGPESSAPTLAAEAKPSFWQTLAGFFRAPNLALAGGLAAVLLLLLFGWVLLRKPADAPEIVEEKNENQKIEQPPPSPSIAPETSPLPDSNTAPLDNSNAAGDPDQPAGTEIKKPLPANTPAEKREMAPRPRIFFATLLPATRSGSTPVLTIPQSAESVRISVVHDNLQPFVKYRAEIRDSNGSAVLVREFPVNEKSLSRPVRLDLKSASLGAGSYELTLSGVREDNRAEEIKFYNFSVRKK